MESSTFGQIAQGGFMLNHRLVWLYRFQDLPGRLPLKNEVFPLLSLNKILYSQMTSFAFPAQPAHKVDLNQLLAQRSV